MSLTAVAPKGTKTVSYRDLAEFMAFAQKRLADRDKEKAETKFDYALRKVLKSCERLWTDYLETRSDIDIEHAATDKDGVIKRDDKGNLAYTKDGMKSRATALRKVFDETVDVPVHIAEAPKGLTEEERDIFVGFVLAEG